MNDCRKELFDLMAQEHDKHLLDTELWDIIMLCEKGIKDDLRKLVEEMRCSEDKKDYGEWTEVGYWADRIVAALNKKTE